MKQNYLLVLFLLSITFGLAKENNLPMPPSASISGNATVCQNATSPVITFTGSGGTAPYTFGYTRNGGPTIFVTTTGTNNSVTVSVNTSVAGTFTYSLVNVEDDASPPVSSPASGSAVVIINPQANANLNSSAELITFNGIPTFRICSNQATIIDFFNASTTLSTNTSYTINWGDGTPNFTSASWNNISHTYQVGLWTLIYTITAQNGCNISRTYRVFVGNNPAVGLENPGNTDVCITSSLTFPITGTENNPPGTTYTVTFNDNTPPTTVTFNHPPPSSVTHTFLNSSCGTSSSSGANTFQNSFFASIIATNPCDQSSATVVPIRISTPPDAAFVLPQTSVCTGNQICISNSSTGGDAASSTTCSTPKLIWTIIPNSGYTLASGTLGNDFSSTNTNSWASGTESICPIFNVGGTYTITLKIGNRCGIDEFVRTICVQPPLTPLFTLNTDTGCIPLAVTATNTTSLANQCSTPTYLWSVTYSAAYCGTTITPISNQTTVNANYNFTEPGIYTITLTTTNSCGSTTTTRTVTVKKPPTASIAAISNFCGTASINPVATINSCAPSTSTLTYSWNFSGGTPATANTVNPGTITYANPGNYVVSLIVTNECGASSTATQNFIVNIAPVITNTDLSQTICSGNQTTLVTLTATPPGTTFIWTAVATPGITGFTASGTNTIPIQTLTTSNTNPGTVTYTIIPTFNGCVGPTVTYVITVNPAPTITTQPTSSSVCLNGNPTPLVVALNTTTGTPTYQWYSNTVNSTTGGTLIPGATNSTFTPPSTTVGTFYYYCIITLSSGGCAGLTSAVAEVIITPLPTIATQPLITQNICVGVTLPNPLTATFTGGLGTPSYQWFSNTSNSNTGGTLIPGATSATYLPPVFTTAGTNYYYVVITLSGGGCGATSSATAEVVVFDDPILTTQPIASQTLCQNATPQTLEVIPSGGSGSFTYQWYSNTANNTTSGNLIPGATSSTYTPSTTAVGTIYYYCIVTQTTPGCSVTSATAAIIINISPTIVTQPQSSTVCLGGTPTILQLTFSNVAGTVTYQWYSNTTNNTVSGVAIVGAINATFTPPADTIGVVYYYCLVTFSGISGSCATISTNTATVTVIPGATIDLQPITTQNLCLGATLANALTVSYSGGTGSPSYQWYSNTTSSNIGGTLIPGATSATYLPPVFTTAGTYYYYVVITLSGGGCGATSSNTAEVVVFDDPILTTQPIASQTLCQNATPQALEVFPSGGNGSFTYQWYSNTANNTTSGTLIPGATNAIYTPQTAIVGTVYYYCIVTQATPGCSVTSATAAIIINISPTIDSQPSSSTVCLGGTPSTLQFTSSNGAGTVTYQWYSNINNDTTSGVAIVGETNDTFTPPADTLGVVYYYCLVTFSGISGSCATISTNTAIVTVIPGVTIDLQPLITQNLCVGATLANALSVSYSGGTGSPSYQWYSNTSASNTGGTLIPGATSATYLPPVFTTVGNYYYYVIITLSGSGCGSINSDVAEISIVNDPILTSQPIVEQTLCQNATANTLTVVVSGGVGNIYTYQWYVSNTNSTTSGSIIVGETNDTYNPPTDSAGTLYYFCIVTQPNDTGCSVTSDTATINVILSPAIENQPQSSTICLGQTITALSFTYINGVGSPIFQWYSNTSNTNTGGTLILGAINSTYSPPLTLAGTNYYYCEVTFPLISGGCELIITNTAEIVINPIPVIANEATTICSGTSFIITPTNSGGNSIPAGTTYIWSEPLINPAGSVTGASLQNDPQNEISQTLINTTTSPATVTYTVIPSSGICIGETFTITVTVNPSINPNIVVSNSTCFGINNASITTAITGGIPFATGLPYLINWTGPSGFTSTDPSIMNLSPGVYTLSVEDAGGCPFFDTYTITEPTDILITLDSENDITCFGFANGSVDLTITGGTGNYFYTWTLDGNPFSSNEDISNLSPGNYTVSVTDANNCGPKIASFTITQPPLLEVGLVSQTNVFCFGESTGTITISAIGGTPSEISPGLFDYSFAWEGPNGFSSTSQNLTNIPSGTYNLTVTDSLGCIENLSVTISQSPEIIISYTTTPITCYGANNASILTTISGGNAPYQFQWNNLSITLNQTNLSAGTYIITVTDNLGCIKSETIIIPEAPIFTVNPIVSNISCFGANDGSINLNLTGGIPPVALTWSDGSTSGLIRNNLGPGTYTATISDGTPCFIVRTFTIVEPQSLILSSILTDPLVCDNANSGAINLIVAGGTPPFTYVWSNGATSEDLTDISSGNYLVTVTDSNGCTISEQYSLIRPAPIQIAVNTQTDFDCEAHEVTQRFVAQATGGFPPYQFQWSSGTISGVNDEIMTTDTNGTVILTVNDSIGCEATYTVTVDTPELGYASFDTTSFGYTTYGIYSLGDPIQFESTITGDYISVIWDFGDGTFSNELNPIHTYDIAKDYVVTQTVTYPFGCVYIQTITLQVEKGYVLVVPTAFTPNNDSLNDTFRPVTKRLKNVKLTIYDSWGSLIYAESGDVLVGWDGKIKGANAENGNYYSLVTAETFYGTIVNVRETFVLIK